MADKKQQLIKELEKTLSDFRELMEVFINSIINKAAKLQQQGDEQGIKEVLDQAEDIHKKKIQEFSSVMFEFAKKAMSMGFKPWDIKSASIEENAHAISMMLEDPLAYVKYAKDKEKQRVRSLEPTENLGSVDVKVLSKDELEDQLFKLHDKFEAAISQAEKDEIQKEIDRVLNLYKMANIKAWIKK